MAARALKSVKLPPPAKAVANAYPALDLLDGAFHRLRLAPVGLLGVYYLGTLPFVLALLYFWADQSRSADAADRALGGALSMAALFVGMKTAQAVFAARLSARLRGLPAPAWTWARLGRLALVQAVLQPPGLFILGLPVLLPLLTTDQNSSAGHVLSVVILSLCLSAPFGWIYAFYQNLTVFGDGAAAATGPVFRRAFRGALHRPKQNHAGLAILTLLGLFVTLNLLALLVGVPYLLRMFTGEENLFTRNGVHTYLNTTFLMVLSSLAYLALDPVAKAFYVLRCFYEDSLRTGEDLLSDLASLPPPVAAASGLTDTTPAAPAPRHRAATATAAWFLLAAVSLALPLRSLPAAPSPPAPAPVAAGPAAPAPAPRSVSPPELRRSIDDVLRRRQFAWRSPRAADKQAAQTGPLDSFFKGVSAWFAARWKTVSGWLHDFGVWLKKWWKPRQDDPVPTNHANGFSLLGLPARPLLIGLAVILGSLIAYLFWQQWQTRRAPVVAGKPVPAEVVPVPDLTDDTVLATQLPEDEWLRLARGLLERGERRLALRAFYLSALSNLAARNLLAIARHKSNRDYLLELRRRARVEPALQAAFGRNVARFERVWYGEHPADDALLSEFQTDRQLALGA